MKGKKRKLLPDTVTHIRKRQRRKTIPYLPLFFFRNFSRTRLFVATDENAVTRFSKLTVYKRDSNICVSCPIFRVGEHISIVHGDAPYVL